MNGTINHNNGANKSSIFSAMAYGVGAFWRNIGLLCGMSLTMFSLMVPAVLLALAPLAFAVKLATFLQCSALVINVIAGVWALIVGLCLCLVGAFFLVGERKVLFDIYDTGTSSLARAFSGRTLTGRMFGLLVLLAFSLLSFAPFLLSFKLVSLCGQNLLAKVVVALALLVLAIAWGVSWFVCWYFSLFYLVDKNAGIVESLKASCALRGAAFKVFIIYLLLYMPSLVCELLFRSLVPVNFAIVISLLFMLIRFCLYYILLLSSIYLYRQRISKEQA